MRNNCFDEGIIQAFFDGELESGMLEQVARHVSDCDACAILMSDIEGESATVAMAFEKENFELVPTERLRTKIFTEIAEYESTSPASWLKKAAAALGFSNGIRWTFPTVAAFASLVFVVGVVGFVIMSKPADVSGPVAANIGNIRTDIQKPTVVTPSITDVPVPVPAIEEPRSSGAYRQASYVAPRETYRTVADVRPAIVDQSAQPLQEEHRYLQTIDTLKKSVDGRKDETFKPSNLVSYERDMAVVDDAINKMQKVVRKNPKDEASKQLLMASYQNKIDLLSAASEKTELMASMR